MKKKIILTILITVASMTALGLFYSDTRKTKEVDSTTMAHIDTRQSIASSEKNLSLSSLPAESKTEKTSDVLRNETEDLSKLPALYSRYNNGKAIDIIKEEILGNGESKIITFRYENGRIGRMTQGVLGGTSTGYNIDKEVHSYNDYVLDTLRILSNQEDRDAQLLLGYKLLNQKKLEEATEHLFAAARNGYSAGLNRLALRHTIKKDDVTAQAFRMLANATAPEIIRSNNHKFSAKLSKRTLDDAKVLANKLRQQYNYYKYQLEDQDDF